MSDVDAAWLQHVTDLADAAGIELTPDDIPVLLNARVEAGWDAEGTEEAFAQFVGENYEDDDEDWYEDEDPDEDTDDMPEQDADVSPQLESDLAYNLARLQDRIGRPPTQHEITAAAEQVRDALARGGGPAEIAAAIEGSAKLTADMTSAEVRAFQVDRLRDGQPTVADRLEQDAANGREFQHGRPPRPGRLHGGPHARRPVRRRVQRARGRRERLRGRRLGMSTPVFTNAAREHADRPRGPCRRMGTRPRCDPRRVQPARRRLRALLAYAGRTVSVPNRKREGRRPAR